MFAPQQNDDTNSLSLDSTFNSEEIIQILRPILDKNITSDKLKTNIVNHLANELRETSLNIKMERINRRLRQCHEMLNDFSSKRRSDEEINMRINSVRNELFDILSFVQMLSGLNPQGALECKIKVDFIEAFNFLHKLIHMIKWTNQSPKILTTIRQQFDHACMQIFTSIINLNITKFDSKETLDHCLTMLLDVDFKGLYSMNLILPLRGYYENIQLQSFKENPTLQHLNSVLYTAAKKGIIADLIPYINLIETPVGDPRKARMLLARVQLIPELKEITKNAVLNCDNSDALIQALEVYSSDEDITTHYLTVLAKHCSSWLNAILVWPSWNSPNVRVPYSHFKRMFEKLSDSERSEVFLTITESDVAQSVASMYKMRLNELATGDDMCRDISTIINLTIR